MRNVTLISGGARSGKSRQAVELCKGVSEKAFIATALPIDEEMRLRISAHQAERGNGWTTIEEPLGLAKAITQAARSNSTAVVDCLTVWLANLFHHYQTEQRIEKEFTRLLDTLKEPPMDLVLVTNEVGLGIVPADRETRTYRDLLGGLNQRVAACATNVQFMVCGIPMIVKETKNS